MGLQLNRILQETGYNDSFGEVLNFIITRILESVVADCCSIFLCDDDTAEFVLVATQGLTQSSVGKFRIRYGDGLIGMVGQREEPMNLENAPAHENYVYVKGLGDHEYHGFLGLPILYQGNLQGVLILQQREAEVFFEEDVANLITLTSQLGGELFAARAKGALQKLLKGKRSKKSGQVLVGSSSSKGVVIGRTVIVYPPANLQAVPDKKTTNIDDEIAAYEQALLAAREDLHELQVKSKKALSVAENVLFDAYLRILDSRSLSQEIIGEIKQGQWAQGALKRVMMQHIGRFEGLEDEYLRERAADFRDLGRRILFHLQSEKTDKLEYPQNTILVSEEVSATSIMEVPEGRLKGIVSGDGSSNSHVAILARALGIPAVMGVGAMELNQMSNVDVIVDGYHGQVYVSPPAALKKEFKQLVLEEQELDQELQALRSLPAKTLDDYTMGVFVNTGLAVDSAIALSVGADGVGLYRSEMAFMLRDRFPTESEQKIMYRQLLSSFSPRQVVMRTLDIGGDKQLPYFPIEEENPFLGWRGIRVTLDHPDLFLQQVRAMLQANHELDNLAIMLPMICTVGELEKSLRLIDQAYDEVIDEGMKIKKPDIGIMIEVPAAIYQVSELASRVDFLSVGTNDLIQYLLAVDRNNPRVASVYDGLHPSVLRALHQLSKGAKKKNKPISVCGELASDPLALVLLVGMGFTSVSMSASALLRMKWVVRSVSLEEAQQLVKEVIEMEDAKEVRCYLESFLDEKGLGGLIRAGK